MSDAKTAAALDAVVTLLAASAEPMSGRAIKAALAGAQPRSSLESALIAGLETGQLESMSGAKGARLYRVGGGRARASQSVPDASHDDMPGQSRLLTRRELAELLAVNMMTVTKWERDGLPIAQVGRKGKPSYYQELDVRAWLAAREEAAQTSGVVDVARERARKDRAQAILAEQTFQIRNRDLLPRVDVEKAWAAEVGAVRTKLLSWSTTIADEVYRAGTLDGLAGVERVLRDAVEDVLRELADPERIQDEPSAPTDDGEQAAA